jgi:hypothetical protein
MFVPQGGEPMEQGNGRGNDDAPGAMGDRRIRRIAGAGLLATLCAAALFGGQFTDDAGGKKKKKKYNLVGKWRGTTEDDGTVSFTLTRGGKILGFTLTNAELECRTQPTESFEYKKTVTITHGPMPMKAKSRKWPQGKRFEFHDPVVPRDSAGEGGDFTGKLADLVSGPNSPFSGQILFAKAMVGEVAYEITNGPTPPDPAVWAPGTEECDTGHRLIDWSAKKPGTPGIVTGRGR